MNNNEVIDFLKAKYSDKDTVQEAEDNKIDTQFLNETTYNRVEKTEVIIESE